MVRRSHALALGLLVSLPAATVASAATSFSATAPQRESLRTLGEAIAEADALDRAGRAEEAARRYADAYRLTIDIESYRGSDVALDIAVASAHAYHSAFEASGDVTLAAESKALLDEVTELCTTLGRPVPEAIRTEHAWAEAQLVEVQQPSPEVVPEPDPEPQTEPEPEPESEPEPEPEPELEPIAAVSSDEDEGEPAGPARPLGPIITGLGLATTIGGAVALVVGVPLRGNAQQYRDETLASPDFAALGPDDQQLARRHLDTYVADERRRGTTLMAVGGTAAGLGVAAVVVGGILWARDRRRAPGGAARVVPQLHVGRNEVTSGFRLRF